MKTAEIEKYEFSGKPCYVFTAKVGDVIICSSHTPHDTMEEVTEILKDHFPKFKIVDKTGE